MSPLIVRFMIVLPPKNLGVPAREPITLSNSLTHLRKYLRMPLSIGWLPTRPGCRVRG